MRDLIENELNIGDVVVGSPRGSRGIRGIYLITGFSDKTIRLIRIKPNQASCKTWDYVKIMRDNPEPIASVIKYPSEYLPFEWQDIIRQEQQAL